ncbi:FHA domain-containing protein [Evansella sp. AB-rgal1]|uniref:FHA domain-containing protein n=1 Tax=Evansella sp. AB-rgal1 TaxID=3242696 RepID=UPI00359CFB12
MIKWLDFSSNNDGQLVKLLNRSEVLRREELESLSTHDEGVSGLVPFALAEQANGWEFSYHLENMITLEKHFGEGLTKEKIVTSFLPILKLITNFQENEVDLNKLVLHERYIYLDQYNQPYFIYVPFQPSDLETTTLLQFFRKILSKFPFEETDDLVFFVKLHNYLIQSDTSDISALKEKLMEMGGIEEATGSISPVLDMGGNAHFYSPTNNSIDAYSSRIQDKKEGKTSTPSDLLSAHNESVQSTSFFLQRSDGEDGPEDTKGTTVLGTLEMEEVEGTTTLDDVAYKPHLLLLSTNEKIILTKSTFTIGRDSNNTDYTLSSKVIGRVHAKILSSDGVYFIKDNNSRNGTYVNGVRLQPMERMKVKHEDKIKMANEEFEFRIF